MRPSSGGWPLGGSWSVRIQTPVDVQAALHTTGRIAIEPPFLDLSVQAHGDIGIELPHALGTDAVAELRLRSSGLP